MIQVLSESIDSMRETLAVKGLGLQRLHPSVSAKVGANVVKWDGVAYGGLLVLP